MADENPAWLEEILVRHPDVKDRKPLFLVLDEIVQGACRFDATSSCGLRLCVQ